MGKLVDMRLRNRNVRRGMANGATYGNALRILGSNLGGDLLAFLCGVK